MHTATLRVEVEIGSGWRTKRRTVRAILTKIRQHFNVSAAEVEGATCMIGEDAG